MIRFGFCILKSIRDIRKGKQRADNVSIYDFITRNNATNITQDYINDRIKTLLEVNMITNKKTTKGYDSFFITDTAINILDKDLEEVLEDLEVPIPIVLNTPILDKHNAPDLQERIGDMKAEIVALKHFVMDEIVSVKNSVENGNLLKSNHDPRLIEILLDEIKYLREENENKNCIIKTLAENQKQRNREYLKISSQEKIFNLSDKKINSQFPRVHNEFI